jgi:hypothetical protein
MNTKVTIFIEKRTPREYNMMTRVPNIITERGIVISPTLDSCVS